MDCSACGAENPPGARFCNGCGTALATPCAACGQNNPPASRFCNGCGNALTATPETAPATSTPAREPPAPTRYTPSHLSERILAARESLIGERKQVTVLFADVVGSTELIRDRDAEEAQLLLDGIVQLMMDAVHRYEGTVSRLMGDGLMAMFGAPLAHEDHAVRACYAALALLDAARNHAEQLRRTHGITAAVRVGISSGEVVVRTIRDDLHMDYTAMGQTVHLAARMEGIAAPGSAVMTAETLTLVEGYVQVQALGPVPVKGLADPIDVYQLTGAEQTRTRLQAAATRGLTRFVGRDAEMKALYHALDRAATGQGQVAALVGEPGVGKSRLVWELTHSHRVQNWRVLESGSVSYGKATSYLPVIDLLKAYCRIETTDDARAIREKVTGKLLTLDRALEPCLPPLLALLDVPTEDPTWEALDPPQRRRQTLDAVKRLLLRESQEQPLLLVFEDLHWIDSETQALLDTLIESLPAARILLLVNYRPEYSHTWGSKTYYTQLRIDPLGEASADELLAGLLGNDASLEPLKTLLTARTEGNPLFLEESVRSLVETGALMGERGAYQLPVPTVPMTSLRVPATVQAVLAARIDRLPPSDKALLQTAAVIGKDVPDVLLRAIADCPDTELQRGLAHLQAAEFLYQARLFPELEYTFKHALTHEVAYGSLLQERRKSIHARVVDAIESAYSNRLSEHVEPLAHHALRAERWEQAVRYCQQAGQKSAVRSVHGAAIERFEQALAALGHLPETREHLEAACDLRVGLRAEFGGVGRFEDAIVCAREAVAVAARLDDLPRLCSALVAPGTQLIIAGRHNEAIDLLQRGLSIAKQLQDRMLIMHASQSLGHALMFMGEYRQSIQMLSLAIAQVADNTPLEAFGRIGTNTYLPATGRMFLACCLAEIGEFDQAEAIGAEATRMAESIQHDQTTMVVYRWLGHAHERRGNMAPALALLERGQPIAQQLNPPMAANYHVDRALAYAATSRAPEANLLMDTWLASANRRNMTAAPVAAETCLLLGRLNMAHELALATLAQAQSQHERGHEARMLWLLGGIAARHDPPDLVNAEHHYVAALTLAEELGMRPLQAHCHLGLGKLYRQLGRFDEAQAELQTAVTMLRDMGMTFWLPDAEAELAQAANA